MSTLVENAIHFESFCTILAILCILRSREVRVYWTLFGLLLIHLLSNSAESMMFWLTNVQLFSAVVVYQTYFYVFWICFAIKSTLSLYVILGIFRSAMAPLKGLRALGMMVFRWAAGIAVTLAFALSFTPHQSTSTLLAGILVQFQQVSGVVTLCLLLFVCFAIKPLGLTYRSRVFGVALGLGVMATSTLIGAAWVAHDPSLHSTIGLWTGVAHCSALLIWSAYFFLPEPKRRIIVLPTTSPFLRWNQISEVLGDAPGFVAIAGVPPELFSPAEIEMMTRASVEMKRLSEFDPMRDSASTTGLTA